MLVAQGKNEASTGAVALWQAFVYYAKLGGVATDGDDIIDSSCLPAICLIYEGEELLSLCTSCH